MIERRLGEWVIRSGDELRLQLPPMSAGPVFRRELQIKRKGTGLTLRGVVGDLVSWETELELAAPAEGRPADNEPNA